MFVNELLLVPEQASLTLLWLLHSLRKSPAMASAADCSTKDCK